MSSMSSTRVQLSGTPLPARMDESVGPRWGPIAAQATLGEASCSPLYTALGNPAFIGPRSSLHPDGRGLVNDAELPEPTMFSVGFGPTTDEALRASQQDGIELVGLESATPIIKVKRGGASSGQGFFFGHADCQRRSGRRPLGRRSCWCSGQTDGSSFLKNAHPPRPSPDLRRKGSPEAFP